jgi:hypothetical protein
MARKRETFTGSQDDKLAERARFNADAYKRGTREMKKGEQEVRP